MARGTWLQYCSDAHMRWCTRTVTCRSFAVSDKPLEDCENALKQHNNTAAMITTSLYPRKCDSSIS